MSKPTPSLDERKQYACHSFAVSSFRGAKSQIELLLKLTPEKDQDLCIALSTSILTHYFRPFKGRSPFKIEDKMIPAESITIHRELETLRDKIYAHRDQNLPDASWGNVNEAGIVVHGNTVMPKVFIGVLTEERSKELLKIIKTLDDHFVPLIAQFLKKYVPVGLSQGEYVFDLKNENGAWLIKQS